MQKLNQKDDAVQTRTPTEMTSLQDDCNAPVLLDFQNVYNVIYNTVQCKYVGGPLSVGLKLCSSKSSKDVLNFKCAFFQRCFTIFPLEQRFIETFSMDLNCIPTVGMGLAGTHLTSSVLCHLDQLGINGLVGLTEHRDQVPGLFHVVGGKKGVGRARFLTSGCASNAVDIILGGVRVVIIDDKFHILHICESVAVWQNKTWRPHRSLHTTTARSKGKVSN